MNENVDKVRVLIYFFLFFSMHRGDTIRSVRFAEL